MRREAWAGGREREKGGEGLMSETEPREGAHRLADMVWCFLYFFFRSLMAGSGKAGRKVNKQVGGCLVGMGRGDEDDAATRRCGDAAGRSSICSPCDENGPSTTSSMRLQAQLRFSRRASPLFSANSIDSHPLGPTVHPQTMVAQRFGDAWWFGGFLAVTLGSKQVGVGLALGCNISGVTWVCCSFHSSIGCLGTLREPR